MKNWLLVDICGYPFSTCLESGVYRFACVAFEHNTPSLEQLRRRPIAENDRMGMLSNGKLSDSS